MRKKLPEVLAILALALPVFLAHPAVAGEIKIARPSRAAFEVSGGTGGLAWHIRYGTLATGAKPDVIPLAGPGSIAYFSHGSWLRRVDTEKGVVTGRWHFPGSSITALTLTGDHIRVEVEDRLSQNRSFRRVLDFNPGEPKIPYWPTASFFSLGVPQSEMNCFCNLPNIEPGQAQDWLPEAENAAERDPLSPWLRISLAHVYAALGKPEASQVLDEAAKVGPDDFPELFRVSSTLDRERRSEAARLAFERGYADYWRRGNDPRLLSSLLARVFYYPVALNPSDEFRPELIERGYRVAPWVEGADYAWDAYARWLKERGDSQEAEKWSQRAEEARSHSLFPVNRTLQSWFAVFTALVAGSLLATLLYFVVLFFRYLPEDKIRSSAAGQAGTSRRWAFFHVEYWSRVDRFGFLSILAAGWLSIGLAASFVSFTWKAVSLPLSEMMGSFAGPTAVSHLESLPKSPDRDLLLAMAYQHDEQFMKAEALYRQLPQFPESWNNLGALLKDSNRPQEAEQAFERASQLDPELVEPRLNLGGPSSDMWTESHQTYVSDRAMLTPPRREHVTRVLGFGSISQAAVQSLWGPIGAARALALLFGVGGPAPPPRMLFVVIGFLILFFIVAVTIVVLQPLRDVTQAPPKYQVVAELLLPGTAVEWRYFGGIALVAWAYVLCQWLMFSQRLRFLFHVFPYGGIPNMRRAFGIPIPLDGNLFGVQTVQAWYTTLASILILLYAVNAALIWYSRRRSPATLG